MVDPITVATSASLSMGATKSPIVKTGTELVTTLPQAGRVATSINEVEKATAAEKAQIGSDHIVRRKRSFRRNFPQPNRKDSGESALSHVDAAWEEAMKPKSVLAKDQGLEGGHSSNPWSKALQADRLGASNGQVLDLAA